MMWRGGSRILRGRLTAEFEAWGLEFFVRSGSRILQGFEAVWRVGARLFLVWAFLIDWY